VARWSGRRHALAGRVVIGSAVLGGCASPALPSGEPSIRGAITGIMQGSDGFGMILVEETSPQGRDYDKASLTITEDTKLLKRVGDECVAFTFDDLSEGVLVEVWITGPVAESYPIRAAAHTILEAE